MDVNVLTSRPQKYLTFQENLKYCKPYVYPCYCSIWFESVAKGEKKKKTINTDKQDRKRNHLHENMFFSHLREQWSCALR